MRGGRQIMHIVKHQKNIRYNAPGIEISQIFVRVAPDIRYL
jgi:hypothetical protein